MRAKDHSPLPARVRVTFCLELDSFLPKCPIVVVLLDALTDEETSLGYASTKLCFYRKSAGQVSGLPFSRCHVQKEKNLISDTSTKICCISK